MVDFIIGVFVGAGIGFGLVALIVVTSEGKGEKRNGR